MTVVCTSANGGGHHLGEAAPSVAEDHQNAVSPYSPGKVAAILTCPMPPSGFGRRSWARYRLDVAKFMGRWWSRALALGWTPEELFSIDPDRPFGRTPARGLLVAIKGRHVVRVERDRVLLRRRKSVRWFYRPMGASTITPVWDVLGSGLRLETISS